MRILAGTSGFSYEPWKGPFYPADLKSREMLRYYAERLGTVEINNTFYRMPKASMLEKWAEQVPAGFRFVLKASRRITHQAKIDPEKAGDSVEYLWEQARVLGEKLGPILFQLPPYVRKDVDRLGAFLDGLPAGMRAAMEFRHASWLEDEVYEVLRAHGAALVAADFDEEEAGAPIVATSDFGYVRLRASSYSDAELADWLAQFRSQPWSEAYVFFKHEDEGVAPQLALKLKTIAAQE